MDIRSDINTGWEEQYLQCGGRQHGAGGPIQHYPDGRSKLGRSVSVQKIWWYWYCKNVPFFTHDLGLC